MQNERFCWFAGSSGKTPSGELTAVRRQPLHYFDIVEPAAALEYLELELDRLIEQGVTASGEAGFQVQGGPALACSALCTLIKQECEAEVRFHRGCGPIIIGKFSRHSQFQHRRIPLSGSIQACKISVYHFSVAERDALISYAGVSPSTFLHRCTVQNSKTQHAVHIMYRYRSEL